MMGMQQSYFQRLLLESGNDNLTEKERVKRLRIRRQIKIIRYFGILQRQSKFRIDLGLNLTCPPLLGFISLQRTKREAKTQYGL